MAGAYGGGDFPLRLCLERLLGSVDLSFHSPGSATHLRWSGPVQRPFMLDRYGHHPNMLEVGVDVEWFHSDDTPEGRAVTDEEAAAWVTAVRSHNPQYRLFLKHWEQEMMPPTDRDGMLFVDDSQQFESLDEVAFQ